MAEPTTYIVLGRLETGGWSQIGATQDATNAEVAIRVAVGRLAASAQAGTYVAVPARSWKPVTVTAETTTVLKLESAPVLLPPPE